MAAGEEPQLIRIYQCDLGRLLLLNPRNKTYRVIALENAKESLDPSAPSRPTRTSRSGTVVTLTTTVMDTGLRREIDGKSARGINTDTTADSPEGACTSARKIRLNSRGWYADMPGIDASCAEPTLAGLRLRPSEPECSDRVVFRMKGSLPSGLPLLIESTLGTSEGEVSMKQELVSISEVEGLEAALFEAPSGFRLVQTQEELLVSDDKAVTSEASLTRPERATRSGESRPELPRVCVAPVKGVESGNEQSAQLRLGGFLNRQGFASVIVPAAGPERSAAAKKGVECAFAVAVEKMAGQKAGPARYRYQVSAVDKPGRAKHGQVTAKPEEAEDQLWENLAKAIAGQISKKK